MASSIHRWFNTPLGRTLMEVECRLLSRRLAAFNHRSVLQVGAYGAGERPALFGDVRQWLVDDWPGGPVDVAADAAEMPLASEAVDAVVLIHQLEFHPYPHQVLREAERVLAPEGRLFVLGFKPLSLWGVRRMLAGFHGTGAPWSGHYFGRFRLYDWLKLLGLEVQRREGLFCRPPVDRRALLSMLAPMERLSERYARGVGGVALTVAHKRVAGMTPLAERWRPRLRVVHGGLASASRVAERSGTTRQSRTTGD